MEIYHDDRLAIVANDEYKFFYNVSVQDANTLSTQMQSRYTKVRNIKDSEQHLFIKGYEKVKI